MTNCLEIKDVVILSFTPTLYEILSLSESFHEKQCHSSQIKLNNRSYGSSTDQTSTVSVITEDMNGTLTPSVLNFLIFYFLLVRV